MTDRELVEGAQRGDLDCFGKLVERHRGAIHGLAYHWTGRFAEAEDIAQEVFVRAYLRLDQLRDPERFAAWLWQLARHECGRWQRRHRPAASLEEMGDTVASDEPNPSEVLEGTETRRLVQVCLRALSDKNRLAISLRYLGGLSYEEIAQFLDLTTNAVAARLHRAHKELEGHLMDTVGGALEGEQLDEEFTRKVLAQAQQRARETQARWQREAFRVSVEQGLQAARQLQDRQAEMEMLSLQGDAASSWLGEAAEGVASYEAALELARQDGDRSEEARVLTCLYKAHLRHGNWEPAHRRAGEAAEACGAAGDLGGRALARAAQDLADRLPEGWKPGDAGGYAVAAFPCTVDAAGTTWGELQAERHYSWGCPSRCAALMHLYRPLRLLGPSLDVGATWEDGLGTEWDGMSWSQDASLPELVARSEVVSCGATVTVPGGRFEGCVEVRTSIEYPGGGRAPEHTARHYCGERRTWYAPGVGLVQVRHADQNEETRLVQLVEAGSADGGDCFPLEPGRWWRYRWREAFTPATIFEDVCRVVDREEGTAWIASATWGWEQAPDRAAGDLRAWAAEARRAGDAGAATEALEAALRTGGAELQRASCRQELVAICESRLEAARQAGDLQEQAAALRALARHLEPGVRQGSVVAELGEVCGQLGDEWGVLVADQALRAEKEGTVPEHDVEMLRERLDLARRLGDGDRERDLLAALPTCLREAGRYREAEPLFEAYAQALAPRGDVVKTAEAVSRAELCRAFSGQPKAHDCVWWAGEAHLPGGSARAPCPEGRKHPEWRTPVTDLFQMVPLSNASLLAGEVGVPSTDWYNTEVAYEGGHRCESLRVTSTLGATDEAVEVAAGRFTGCGRIDVTMATSDERPTGEDAVLDGKLGFYAGTKQAWFAPGVGLVKLTYHHRNGLLTEVELVDYEMAEDGGEWVPQAIGSRWRYAWTEPDSGARFEEVWRVAARRGDRWSIGFVTWAAVDGD